MNLLKRKISIETTYGNAKYIREPLLNLGVKYDTKCTADRVRYEAYLSGREMGYFSNYLLTLGEVGVYPVLL